MRIERAKIQLEEYKNAKNDGKSFSVNLYEEVDNIIEALSKQIPMKPAVRYANIIDDIGCMHMIAIKICPVCGCDLADHGNGVICTNSDCRQAIDWSEVE